MNRPQSESRSPHALRPLLPALLGFLLAVTSVRWALYRLDHQRPMTAGCMSSAQSGQMRVKREETLLNTL